MTHTPHRDEPTPLVPELALSGYRAMVLGRRFDQQATNLAKQGHLAVYPSSAGQDACQVGLALALTDADWLFPTYRDCVAVLTRGVAPGQALAQMRGGRHCGYDPRTYRTAPQCAPLATHLPHAVGLAMAARRADEPTVALALCGEGATSEGDFHEALNLAAVFNAPVVFVIQNNGYAISTPTNRQFAAASLADRALGYGMPGRRIDGNDFARVYTTVSDALDRARMGDGPTLIEAVTYRLGSHTTSDDPSRYRQAAEAADWPDPISTLRERLDREGILTPAVAQEIASAADDIAARTRTEVLAGSSRGPLDLLDHVYHQDPPALMSARAQLLTSVGGPR